MKNEKENNGKIEQMEKQGVNLQDAAKALEENLQARKDAFLRGLEQLAQQTRCRLDHTIVIKNDQMPKIITQVVPF